MAIRHHRVSSEWRFFDRHSCIGGKQCQKQDLEFKFCSHDRLANKS
jgi:hypothetical protein